MLKASRREFVRAVGSTAALSAVAYNQLVCATVTGAKPVLGLIGCGGRSQSLSQGFQDHATIAWACDPDEGRAKHLQKQTGAAQTTSDLRRVLDDAAVQAVVIATPDHWHAPAAIMACDAGKHVYVEKPCSHNFRESQLLVQAAARNNVIVQHGTQSRSSQFIADAIQILKEGGIGDVLMAKGWNIQRRQNIGHSQPSSPPPGLDYDTWIGPAEEMPFQQNRLHYNWHWWHNFGTGDIGNDGAHEMDIACWGLGVTGLPSSATAFGGKYYFDDDQQFPDTATCAFEWPGDHSVGQRKQLIFEMRIWSKNYPYNCDTGVEFYGTKGMLFVSKRNKLQMWDDSNQLVPDPKPNKPVTTAKNHQVDFLEAMASGRKPSADIRIAHDSVALIHLANIAVRTNRSVQIDPVNETILGDDAANQLLTRTYRSGGHWSVPKGV